MVVHVFNTNSGEVDIGGSLVAPWTVTIVYLANSMLVFHKKVNNTWGMTPKVVFMANIFMLLLHLAIFVFLPLCVFTAQSFRDVHRIGIKLAINFPTINHEKQGKTSLRGSWRHSGHGGNLDSSTDLFHLRVHQFSLQISTPLLTNIIHCDSYGFATHGEQGQCVLVPLSIDE